MIRRHAGRRRLLLTALVLVAAGACVVAVLTWPRDPAFTPPKSTTDLLARLDRVVPEAMRTSDVPAASLAVVHDGRVVATRGYGGASAQTPFQVGSVSKPVAAAGLLRLAVTRRTAPDAALRFRGWAAPPGLTLRRLLSHTAGLSVDGYLGLPPERPLPSTLDELLGRGEQPVLRRVGKPGAELRYSGGGYTAAQLWAEQETGTPLAALMQEEILRPLAMTGSTFAQDRPPQGATSGHDADGRPVPSYRYAAQTAAGLWSTAADLGRFVVFAMSADPVARAMRVAAPGADGHWGMGLELQGLRTGGTLVEHEGINRGWHAQIVAAPKAGWGLAVLTNADGGGAVVHAAVGELVE